MSNIIKNNKLGAVTVVDGTLVVPGTGVSAAVVVASVVVAVVVSAKAK